MACPLQGLCRIGDRANELRSPMIVSVFYSHKKTHEHTLCLLPPILQRPTTPLDLPSLYITQDDIKGVMRAFCSKRLVLCISFCVR